ncbi:MAG: nitrogen fixation protein NifQ [Pseudomonadota bacterium]
MMRSELMVSVITNVLRHAHEGVLPLFARTLALPQQEFMALVAYCFPDHDLPVAIPEFKYAALLRTTPSLFREVAALLVSYRSPDANVQHAEWLARAIAAASLGGRFLWQDLGLSGRDALSALLKQYFEPFYRRNDRDLKWKQLLYTEVGILKGNHGAPAPGCRKCEQFEVCYAH